MTPPTLHARRIASLVASKPLVRIVGAAGPLVAVATRTGVAAGFSTVALLLQPATSTASATTIESWARNLGGRMVRLPARPESLPSKSHIRAPRAVRGRRSE